MRRLLTRSRTFCSESFRPYSALHSTSLLLQYRVNQKTSFLKQWQCMPSFERLFTSSIQSRPIEDDVFGMFQTSEDRSARSDQLSTIYHAKRILSMLHRGIQIEEKRNDTLRRSVYVMTRFVERGNATKLTPSTDCNDDSSRRIVVGFIGCVNRLSYENVVMLYCQEEDFQPSEVLLETLHSEGIRVSRDQRYFYISIPSGSLESFKISGAFSTVCDEIIQAGFENMWKVLRSTLFNEADIFKGLPFRVQRTKGCISDPIVAQPDPLRIMEPSFQFQHHRHLYPYLWDLHRKNSCWWTRSLGRGAWLGLLGCWRWLQTLCACCG